MERIACALQVIELAELTGCNRGAIVGHASSDTPIALDGRA
jgi:hypothetical protein